MCCVGYKQIKFVPTNTVYTDCQALQYLTKHKTTNAQAVRWCNLLNEYEFDIKYRPGSSMQHVDALSRAPVDE